MRVRAMKRPPDGSVVSNKYALFGSVQHRKGAFTWIVTCDRGEWKLVEPPSLDDKMALRVCIVVDDVPRL